MKYSSGLQYKFWLLNVIKGGITNFEYFYFNIEIICRICGNYVGFDGDFHAVLL